MKEDLQPLAYKTSANLSRGSRCAAIYELPTLLISATGSIGHVRYCTVYPRLVTTADSKGVITSLPSSMRAKEPQLLNPLRSSVLFGSRLRNALVLLISSSTGTIAYVFTCGL